MYPSESPLLPIEYVRVNSIETMEKRQDKKVKEYMHVISKSEALRVHEASVLVSIKA